MKGRYKSRTGSRTHLRIHCLLSMQMRCVWRTRLKWKCRERKSERGKSLVFGLNGYVSLNFRVLSISIFNVFNRVYFLVKKSARAGDGRSTLTFCGTNNIYVKKS